MLNTIPISELRKTTEISDLCHKSQEPVFVTKDGHGDLVVMSMEVYEKLVCGKRINSAIMGVEREVQAGCKTS